MGCLEMLGVQYIVMGRMWGWNNKVLDLETPLGGHENFLPAFVSTEYQQCTREGGKFA